ncbi:hypothetical protein D3C72_1538260 [compost metagenome]
MVLNDWSSVSFERVQLFRRQNSKLAQHFKCCRVSRPAVAVIDLQGNADAFAQKRCTVYPLGSDLGDHLASEDSDDLSVVLIGPADHLRVRYHRSSDPLDR